MILRALIESRLPGKPWVTVSQWICGTDPDINDLFDGISGVEEWPEDMGDGALQMVEGHGWGRLRVTHCTPAELLDLWPVNWVDDVITGAMMRAVRHLKKEQPKDTRILFYVVLPSDTACPYCGEEHGNEEHGN